MPIVMNVIKDSLLKLVLLLSVVFVVSCEEYLPDGELFGTDEYVPSGAINGHGYVDLGLSVKWATCNVGASTPEECGGYYAWGETEEKDNYEWSTYKWANGTNRTITKYCTSSYYGTVDKKKILDAADDVAHVKWGGSWRMPTEDEQNELLNNCTLTWTTLNGIIGCKLTSTKNGNCIFLPVTGEYTETVIKRSQHGYYWPSSLCNNHDDFASCLYFGDDNTLSVNRVGIISRYCGHTVRPVCE